MQNVLASTAPTSNLAVGARAWTGRVLTGLIAAFLLVDAGAKLALLAVVVETTTRMGLASSTIRPMGAVLALSTVLHLLPRTQLVGAVLLTAYLGGATATHVHLGQPFWFPVAMGVSLWIAYGLRNPRLRGLVET